MCAHTHRLIKSHTRLVSTPHYEDLPPTRTNGGRPSIPRCTRVSGRARAREVPLAARRRRRASSPSSSERAIAATRRARPFHRIPASRATARPRVARTARARVARHAEGHARAPSPVVSRPRPPRRRRRRRNACRATSTYLYTMPTKRTRPSSSSSSSSSSFASSSLARTVSGTTPMTKAQRNRSPRALAPAASRPPAPRRRRGGVSSDRIGEGTSRTIHTSIAMRRDARAS